MSLPRPLSLAAALVLVTSASAAGFAIAAEKHRNSEAQDEVEALNSASLSLADAVTLAEKFNGGRAIAAEFDEEDDVWVYSVEIVNADGTEAEIIVDPTSGDILATEQDDDEEAENESDEQSDLDSNEEKLGESDDDE